MEVRDGQEVPREREAMNREYEQKQAEYREHTTFAIAPGLDIGIRRALARRGMVRGAAAFACA